MDIVAPLVKTGVISDAANMWLAVPTGFLFGFSLYHAGFTDSRRIAGAFYLHHVGVPVVMFTAIVTGMLGLWILNLTGFIDITQMYYLPTYLKPMAVGGVLFGIGMAIGGFCPGTAAASVATGRVDAMVFVVGFLGGSILFGDLFPIWGGFYKSDYRGVFRLDQLFGMEIGPLLLVLTIAAIAFSLLMRFGQHYFWPRPDKDVVPFRERYKYELPLVLLAVVVAGVLSFFPSDRFLQKPVSAWYIIQKQAPAASTPAGKSSVPRVEEQPQPGGVQPAGGEGC